MIVLLLILVLFVVWWMMQKNGIEPYIERENTLIEAGRHDLVQTELLRALAAAADENDYWFLVNRRRDQLAQLTMPIMAMAPPQPRPQLVVAAGGGGGEVMQFLPVTKPPEPKVAIKSAPKIVGKIKEKAKVRSDAQNVHDSSVNSALRDTYGRLEPYHMSDAELVALRSMLSPAGRDTLALIQKENSPVFSLQRTETVPPHLLEVLSRVWGRSMVPANAEQRIQLQKALADALDSCKEPGYIVCSGGITARLLNSLVLLDVDPTMGHVMTADQYKNELMNDAAKAFTALVQTAQGPYAVAMREGRDTAEGEAEFREMWAAKVDELIDAMPSEHRPIGAREQLLAVF